MWAQGSRARLFGGLDIGAQRPRGARHRCRCRCREAPLLLPLGPLPLGPRAAHHRPRTAPLPAPQPGPLPGPGSGAGSRGGAKELFMIRKS